jgi:Mg/Co/Ni transporter MgtE
MVALTWILAIAGMIVAWIVSLAGAMKTVPRLPWREALVGVPLPVVAAALATWRVVQLADSSQATSLRSWIAVGIPLGLAMLALLLMAVSYFEQPGGPI